MDQPRPPRPQAHWRPQVPRPTPQSLSGPGICRLSPGQPWAWVESSQRTLRRKPRDNGVGPASGRNQSAGDRSPGCPSGGLLRPAPGGQSGLEAGVWAGALRSGHANPKARATGRTAEPFGPKAAQQTPTLDKTEGWGPGRQAALGLQGGHLQGRSNGLKRPRQASPGLPAPHHSSGRKLLRNQDENDLENLSFQKPAPLSAAHPPGCLGCWSWRTRSSQGQAGCGCHLQPSREGGRGSPGQAWEEAERGTEQGFQGGVTTRETTSPGEGQGRGSSTGLRTLHWGGAGAVPEATQGLTAHPLRMTSQWPWVGE